MLNCDNTGYHKTSFVGRVLSGGRAVVPGLIPMHSYIYQQYKQFTYFNERTTLILYNVVMPGNVISRTDHVYSQRYSKNPNRAFTCNIKILKLLKYLAGSTRDIKLM